MWGKTLCASEREVLGLWDPSLLYVTRLGVRFLERLLLCFSYPSWYGPFILCCRESYSGSFHFFFSRNYSICIYRCGVSVGEDDFSVFLCCYLGLPPLFTLRHNSGNWKHGKRTNKWPKWSFIKNQPRSLKQRCLSGRSWLGFFSSCVAGHVLISLFIVDDSLKWKPCQSKLKLGMYITKKKQLSRLIL